MNAKPLMLVPKSTADKRADKDSVIECLEELLLKAKSAEVVGMHAIIEYDDEYIYKRVGISYVEALGMLTRATHTLNADWDSKK